MPLALSGTGDSMLVSTSRGYLYLLNESDGSIIWSGRLTASNQSLETPNIWTEPGATTSTAYLAGADGVLYAVIVDGALDTSAPWPKAYHDPQNTSNAGYAP
jgi:outer membrane protein assembly factor BamB